MAKISVSRAEGISGGAKTRVFWDPLSGQTDTAARDDRGIPADRRLRKLRYPVLIALFTFCVICYYFGQVVDWLGWSSLRWEFWYTVHDTHRMFFLAPIVWAAYAFGGRTTLAVTAATLAVFLPRALWLSPFPNPLVRAVLDGLIEGGVGLLVATTWDLLRNRARVAPAVTESPSGDFMAAGDLEVDLSRRLIKRRGRVVRLTKTEYELFSCLVRNHGKVMQHEELLHTVWGPEYGQETEYLRTFVGQLRRKIEDDPANPRYILTEAGFGYRLIELRMPNRVTA